MNINPIAPNTETNFKGKLYLKGKWPSAILADDFSSNTYVQKTLENNSLTAKMKVSYNKFFDAKYKLALSIKKDNPTFLEKVKYAFGLNPKTNLSQHYHSAESTEAIIKKRLKSTLENKLNIEL